MTVQQSKLLHPSYRPDIDGLRAIAVLSVVIFHAFPNSIKGGFIGVDIFFVISGYLISTIILKNLDKGSFSFKEFYSRRIRRIFPALILTLLASLCFGWIALISDEYKQLGKHVTAGAGFISNFVLWSESGYFDNSSEVKPLLHLWSLGIEEQFYVIWPLFLWFFWQTKTKAIKPIIAIASISLALNIYYIEKHPSATFYFPQTRFWELISGSILSWVTIYKKNTTTLKYNSNLFYNTLSASGLLLLATGLCFIDKEKNFPGVWALIPVLGSALIIYADSGAWINRIILSSRILVWFGLISFPLYLWHWPLLSFARIIESETPSISIRLTIIATSIALAWLTYKFIESPIRSAKHGKIKTLYLISLMIIIGTSGYITYKSDGFPLRKNTSLQQENYHLLKWNSLTSQDCELKLNSKTNFCLEIGNHENQKIAIIGDSTGNALAPGLAKIYEEHNAGLVNYGSYGCPPVRGLIATTSWGEDNDCIEGIDNAYRLVLKSKTIDTVVLAFFIRDLQKWGVPGQHTSMEEKFKTFISLLEKDIDSLQKSGKKVIVTYDVPYSLKQARDCIERPLSITHTKRCEINEQQLIDRQPYLSLFDNYFNSNHKTCIVKQSNVLIKNKKLQFFDDSGKLILRDTHHLSYNGSEIVAREFINSGCIDLTQINSK